MPKAKGQELKGGIIVAFEIGPPTKNGEIAFRSGNSLLMTEVGAGSLSKFEIQFITT